MVWSSAGCKACHFRVGVGTLTTPPSPACCPPLSVEFLRHRYASLWFVTRVIRAVEPLSVAAGCAWLSYNSWEAAQALTVTAAVFGSVLVLSFLVACALLGLGLVYGGPWRELPTSMSWPLAQALECVPILVHTAILTQYSRLLGRVCTTPVWALIYSIAYSAHSSHVLQLPFEIGVATLVFAHQSAAIAYDAMTTPDWTSPQNGGSTRFLDTVLPMAEICIVFVIVWAMVMPRVEATRREDFFIHTRAKRLHDVAAQLITNFLPAPVLRAMQRRAAQPELMSPGSDILAWAFEPACILQSDIVGFTALVRGRRGWGRALRSKRQKALSPGLITGRVKGL